MKRILIEVLAKRLHRAYREEKQRALRHPHHKVMGKDFDLRRGWEELEEEEREFDRAVVRRALAFPGVKEFT